MKKKKWDILLPIIIILVMAFILIGYQLIKNEEESKKPVDIHVSAQASQEAPIVPRTRDESAVLSIEDFCNQIFLYKK